MSQTALEGTQHPVAASLDRAVPNRPVMVLDDLGHAIYANSAAIEAAGIAADDPDPQGGSISATRRPERSLGRFLKTRSSGYWWRVGRFT